MKKIIFLLLVSLILTFGSFGQTGVAINETGDEPHTSAMLDVSATNKGLLVPRMTWDERTAISSPAKGLLVYQNDSTEGFYFYDGAEWRNLSLLNFTESAYTYDARNGVTLLVNNDEETADLVFRPKGGGAIMARQPDGTRWGGNNRGYLAVDFQMFRSQPWQVASGTASSIIGGMDNTVSGSSSGVLAGSQNSVSEDMSVILGGNSNLVNAPYSSVVGGTSNNAAGFYSHISGGNYDTVASTYSSIFGSYMGTTLANYSTIVGGFNSKTKGDFSIILGGKGNTASSYGEVVTGLYATEYTPTGSSFFDDEDRLFVVGNGTSPFSSSNALTILKNANTTLGGLLTINGNGTDASITFPDGRGSAGQFLKTNADGTTEWDDAVGGSGLTNFTESNYTYNSKTGVKLLATNDATDVDLVLSPKGAGAILSTQPGANASEGNNRGAGSVDLQLNRQFLTNVASGDYSALIGGSNNRASGANSFVGGGSSCTAGGSESVALGNGATASADRTFAFNGTASGVGGVAIGSGAQATNDDALALGPSSIAAGLASIAIGPSLATGTFAVAIGLQNKASGNFSVAIGKNARTAGRQGSCVISDGSAAFSSDSTYATANNQMTMRFAGGYRLFTTMNLSTGVEMAAGGGSWSSVSDSNRKENFRHADGENFLNSLSKLKLGSWNYKGQDPATMRHYGPMAQEIFKYFGNDRLGIIGNDTMLATADMDGIMMICIQALENRTRDLHLSLKKIEEMEAKMAEQKKQAEEQQAFIEKMLFEFNNLKAEVNDMKKNSIQ